MQTPAGFITGADGRFQPVDWWAVIFNPSFPYRFVHMTIAAMLAAACLIAATGAWHLLKRPDNRGARLMFSWGLWLLLFAAPLQAVVGDLHGENTRDHQPVKLAAMEGSWNPPPPGEGEPLRLFAIPDMQAQRNHFELAIPNIGSLYLRHNLSGTIHSLNQYPADERPWVPGVFFSFRAMVGLGLLMIFFGFAGLVARLRGRLWTSRWLQRGMVAMAPAGFIAMLAGWLVTETGRQPWTIYGVLRTAHSASPVAPSLVLTSFIAIVLVYLATFAIGLFFLLRLLGKAPHDDEKEANAEVAEQTGRGILPQSIRGRYDA